VRLRGRLGDEELLGDAGDAHPVGEQAQHLALAGGQLRALRCQAPFHRLGEIGGGERRRRRRGVPCGRDHLVGRRGLRHERARARLQRPEELVVARVHGQYNDAHGGTGLPQRPGRFQPAAVRQAQVHDHNLGL
jgi:hypothetical protein